MKRLLSKLNQKRAMTKTQSWRKSLAVWWEVLSLHCDFSLSLDCVQTTPLSTRVSKTQVSLKTYFPFSLSPLPLCPPSLPPSLSPSHHPHGTSGELYPVATNVILGFITDSQFHVLYLRFSISEMGMIIQESNVGGNFKDLRWWVL